jgi:signal transduction histidine kinase/streptogramin lyase
VYHFRHERRQPEANNKILGEDAQGNIWIGVPDLGLLSIDPSGDGTAQFVNELYPGQAYRNELFDGFIDKSQRLWMSNLGEDLLCYDIRTKKLRHFLEGRGGYALLAVNDTLLLTAREGELTFFNTVNFRSRTIHAFSSWGPDGAPGNVLDMVFDKDGKVWLCTERGVYVFDLATECITHHFASFGPGSQSYNYVYTAFCDRSGNMWLGTNGDGLKKLVNNTKNFRHYLGPSPKGAVVKAVFQHDSLLYAGLFDNGIDVFHWRKGFLKKLLPANTPGLPVNTSVYAIAGYDERRILLYSNGELDRELGLLDTETRGYTSLRQRLIKEVPTLFAANGPNYPFVFRTSDSDLVFGWLDHLVRLSHKGSELPRFEIIKHFPGVSLTCGYRDRQGKLFIGTIDGFYTNRLGHNWSHIRPRESVLVKSLCEDVTGNLWVGTTDGLYIYNGALKLVGHLNENNGLKNGFIYGILRDADGRMWLSHNKGLSVVDPYTRSIRHFDRGDGLQSNEFNTGAYAPGANGALLFGGINGLNAFFPDRVLENSSRPSVQLTNIMLFDQPLATDAAYTEIAQLKLPYDQNGLSFEFAALEFTNSRRNQYSYKMDGVDKDWIYAGSRRFARYPALAPGNYMFHVKGTNNDGVWQPVPRSLSIVIIPPFWQQTWFRLLAMLAALGVIIAAVWLLQRQRYRKQLRAIELERRIQYERERISRDLHDNVGTQLSLISNNLDWIARPGQPLSQGEQSQKLDALGITAKEVITTLRDTIWALNKEQISLEELADKLKVFVSRQLNARDSVKMNFKEHLHHEVLLSPSEALHLFRICQEAVANALKYAQATELFVTITSDVDGYSITVTDNGIGFDPGKVGAAHYGLENIRFRASETGCDCQISSVRNEGTTVSVRKKLVQMH